jgi:hypothetical protein
MRNERGLLKYGILFNIAQVHRKKVLSNKFTFHIRFEHYHSMYFKPLWRIQLKIEHSKVLPRIWIIHFPDGRSSQREKSGPG